MDDVLDEVWMMFMCICLIGSFLFDIFIKFMASWLFYKKTFRSS